MAVKSFIRLTLAERKLALYLQHPISESDFSLAKFISVNNSYVSSYPHWLDLSEGQTLQLSTNIHKLRRQYDKTYNYFN